MTQYTDAKFTVTVKGLDLTTIDTPYLTFSQGYNTEIDLTDIQVLSANSFVVRLTQAQTGLFKVGEAKMQLNFFVDGFRDATAEKTVQVTENLLKRVLQHG